MKSSSEWEEFRRIIEEFDPDAGPMPDGQFQRFQKLIWDANPPTKPQAKQRDTRTLEEVIDDLNDYRKFYHR